MLTKRSGTLIEFKHDLYSGESCQGNKEILQSIVHSVRKLQNDVNSCLTKIIEDEKTSSTTAMSKGKLSKLSGGSRTEGSSNCRFRAPWQVCPHIDSISDQVLFYLFRTEKQRKKTTLCAR